MSYRLSHDWTCQSYIETVGCVTVSGMCRWLINQESLRVKN